MAMDKYKQSDKLFTLGNRIVEEMGREAQGDTLSSWMAHYIAELIQSAEESEDPDQRAKARERCFETILALWEHRASLPRNCRPLGNLEGVLKSIQDLRAERTPLSSFLDRDDPRIGGPWMEFAKCVEDHGLRVSRIAVLTAIADASFDKEKRWLEESSDLMSEEEKGVIESLDSWLNESTAWATRHEVTSIGELEPQERKDRVLKEFRALTKEIKDGLKTLRSGLKN